MSRRPRFTPLFLVVLGAVLMGAIIVSTAGSPQQPLALRLASLLPNQSLVPGDELNVYGQGCLPRGRLQPDSHERIVCVTFTAVPASRTPRPTLTPTSPPIATLTPTATATSAPPTATATSSPTSTSAPPTLTPTSTSTATPGGGSSFALGIRLDKSDPATLAGWNAHAFPGDAEHSQGANASLLLAAHGNDRQVSCGGAAVLADSCQAAITFALASGIGDLNVNDEGPPCATLVADEARVYQKIHAAGLTMMWAPTGVMLRACPPASFVSNTDRIMFQVEALEQDPSVNFPQTVHDEIALLHGQRADLAIAVQVSVNPPHNRTATAAQVLADVASLEDGSANAPPRVDVFYSMRATAPDRADVMLQVQAALRP